MHRSCHQRGFTQWLMETEAETHTQTLDGGQGILMRGKRIGGLNGVKDNARKLPELTFIFLHCCIQTLVYSNTSPSGPTSTTQLPSVHRSRLSTCFYSYQHKHYCFWTDVGWFPLLLGITVFDIFFWNAYYNSNHCFILAMEKKTAVCKGKVSSTVF